MGILLVVAIATVAGLWSHSSRNRVVSVPVLMYHRIGDEVDSPWWVTPRDFEGHLQALREQGYASILPSELVAHQRWGRPLPAKPVIITFDDGYLNVEKAEPILARYGFRGVCYLITGLVGDGPEARKQHEGTPLLTWPEVRALRKRGSVYFGGHGRTHANLRAMADPRGEIDGCYRDLKRKGGFEPEGFCYPYGQFKDETVEAMSRSRFTSATTCEDGIPATGPELKLLTLPRVAVMGGWHRFHVESRSTAGGKLSYALSKEGRSLEVVPRMTWKTPEGLPQGRWLAPVQVSASPVVVECGAPLGKEGLDPVLELWDNFHIVRYWVECRSSLSRSK